MLHVQFRLDSYRRRVLSTLADESAESISELMRQAVDLLFAERGVTQAVPAPAPVPDLTGWDTPHPPTAAGLPVVDDLDEIA